MNIDSPEGYRADRESDTVGKRKLAKQRCLDMCWSDVKEITAWEIAGCIYRHKFDMTEVPEARLHTVEKELLKLYKEDEHKKERNAIKMELGMYKSSSNRKSLFSVSKEFEDYYLDPDLFETSLEAEIAMDELKSYYSKETTKTSEYDHEYKDTNNTHSRDVQRLQKAMETAGKQYVNLGGLESEFYKHVTQIPLPTKGTLQKDIYQHREVLQKRFINMGVSPARANDIAIAITQKIYNLLK